MTQFCVNGVITGGKAFKPHLNVSLPMSFDLISPIVLDIIQIWASFDPILEYIRQNEIRNGPYYHSFKKLVSKMNY